MHTNRLDRLSYGTVLLASLLSVTMLSCVIPLDRHGAFISHRNNEVGRKIEEVKSSLSVKSYTDGRFLPNGNLEYGFRARGTCRVYYEVDPKTRIIVNWRWEGLQKHCTAGG